MGQAYGVKCFDCDYIARALVGGGMRTYQTMSLYPVYCKACSGLTHINEREKAPGCENCGGQDYVRYGPDTLELRTSSRDESALEGQHICPMCKKFSLQFSLSMRFD